MPRSPTSQRWPALGWEDAGPALLTAEPDINFSELLLERCRISVSYDVPAGVLRSQRYCRRW
jgi:hypothetical protein